MTFAEWLFSLDWSHLAAQSCLYCFLIFLLQLYLFYDEGPEGTAGTEGTEEKEEKEEDEETNENGLIMLQILFLSQDFAIKAGGNEVYLPYADRKIDHKTDPITINQIEVKIQV